MKIFIGSVFFKVLSNYISVFFAYVIYKRPLIINTLSYSAL